MKRLAFSLLFALLSACASLDGPTPLTSEDVIGLSKSGKSAPQIIEELKRTDTVIPLSASEIVRMNAAGVPTEVLDHLQRAQIEEIRWRDRYSQTYWGPLYRGYGPYSCPSGFMGPPYRGRFWSC